MTNYKIIFLVGFLLVFSCKKKELKSGKSVYEQYTWAESPCEENTGNIQVDLPEGVNYRYPVFNPKKEYEFIYYEYTYDAATSTFSDYKLIKYSMLTREKNVILSGKEITGPVAWNENGQLAFIVLTNSVARIYTMQDDGSNLQLQLSMAQSSLPYVRWSIDGSSFYCLYTHELSWNNQKHYLLKKNPNEATIDTIPIENNMYNMDISSKNELINFTGNGYYEVTSLSSDTLIASVYQLEPGMFFNNGLSVNSDGTKFYASLFKAYQFGIYEIDLIQNTVVKLFQGCKSGYIENIDASPSNNHLIMEKRGIMENNHPYQIWIYDLSQNKEALLIGE